MMINFEEIAAHNKHFASMLMQEMWDDLDDEEAKEIGDDCLKLKKYTAYLAKEGESYIGFIFLSMRVDYVEGTTSSPVAYIEGIYLKSAYRKQGIGEKLVALGEKWGRANGAMEYASDVELHNVISQQFHVSLGFKEANRVICFSKKIT